MGETSINLCPFVCPSGPSVTICYCVKMAKRIVKTFSRLIIATSNCFLGTKRNENSPFRKKLTLYISETVHDRTIVITKR